MPRPSRLPARVAVAVASVATVAALGVSMSSTANAPERLPATGTAPVVTPDPIPNPRLLTRSTSHETRDGDRTPIEPSLR
ncbi:hypothetical protein [Streptomyces fractus]|uniref:hypothetical protein n=1 Tax=Streptomyces fractus TaxID=641806 RepID=UPI003CF35D3F